MNKKSLGILCIGALLLCLVSLFAFDHPLAYSIHGSRFESAALFVRGTQLLDHLTGHTAFTNHTIGTVLLGCVLLGLGFIWLLMNRASYTARALAFTGAVQLATVLTAGVIKSLCGRLRPYELFANGHWDHAWLAGGTSFPSGHVSFYWGLFVPLAYLFPRFGIPLMIIPVFISLARINEGAHFLSDVLAAMALAALITLIAAIALHRWVKPTTHSV